MAQWSQVVGPGLCQRVVRAADCHYLLNSSLLCPVAEIGNFWGCLEQALPKAGCWVPCPTEIWRAGSKGQKPPLRKKNIMFAWQRLLLPW